MLTSLLLVFTTFAVWAASLQLGPFQNFVTFGDSFTDESRLKYFKSHHHGPPPGELAPPSNQTYGGGRSWGRVVADITGARYYNYAVGGAMCVDNVTRHWYAPVQGLIPSVLDYEVPAFEADLAFSPALYPDDRRGRADNTVYAVWIGTNDLGVDGFLMDRNVAGTSLPSFVDCVWEVFDRIYAAGGRRFVLLNTVPLDKSPMYASPENGGTGDLQYWTDKTRYNMTETQYKMLEYTRSVNALFEQGVPLNVLVNKRWPGVSFSLFDVHSLILDINTAPQRYLTQPSNVTWPYRTCSPSTGCQQSALPLSSFLWYDELHPSARTSEIVADEFVKVVNGTSQYGVTYNY